MRVDLTEQEIEHIYWMCKSDIQDGERAIANCPKATILQKEWGRCFEIDRELMKKIKYKEGSA